MGPQGLGPSDIEEVSIKFHLLTSKPLLLRRASPEIEYVPLLFLCFCFQLWEKSKRDENGRQFDRKQMLANREELL